MALLLTQSALAQANPMTAKCSEVRQYFRDNTCCGTDATIESTAGFCPKMEEMIAYPAKKGIWNPCPIEEYYTTYSPSNAAAPGYSGCVAESTAMPCGWYDYHEYDASTGTCTQTGTLQTAIQTVRGGSPTMTADMLRLTGAETLPDLTFPMLPMTYPSVRSDPTLPEMGELDAKYKQFMSYYGSQLQLDSFNAYPTYGAEMGMVGSVAIKILELASTTCNRDFYVFLEAPAYGYDWSQAVDYVEARASSYYAGAECPCTSAGTCNTKGHVSISQRGWAMSKYPAMPSENSAKGVAYTPDSTDADSPWIQTNVVPGNPIGRFAACKAPQDRCLCDGVYWYPSFLAPGTVIPDFKCYSWAFSITKIYSAQMRAGVMYIMDYPAAKTAASSIMGKILSIANGLMSHLQVHGQIKIMDQMMEKPFADPTSWLHAMTLAQYEKWDVMDAAFTVCQNAGVVMRTTEQPKYFGAYIFSHMAPRFMGYSTNIGAASSDWFKSVVGYDHFNYNWGWRGEDASAYGLATLPNITSLDFHRTHTFRARDVYVEEARRMTLVCSNPDARVTSSLLTVNEWATLRAQDLSRRRRRKLEGRKLERIGHYERALEIQAAAPKMKLVDAISHAEATDPFQKTANGEYGGPPEDWVEDF